MIVDLAVQLNAPPQTIWDHITRTKTFTDVSWPVMVFVSREPGGFPERWVEGAPHRVWMLLFGVIPFGSQTINISVEAQDGETRRARDAGSGWVSRVWDHELSVTPNGAGTLYRDRVRIEAGLLTPFVWAFAALFFRWRQYRWRAFVRQQFRC